MLKELERREEKDETEESFVVGRRGKINMGGYVAKREGEELA